MARSVRPLLDRVDAALAEARRRVPPDPLASLSPACRAFVRAFEADKTPDELWTSIREMKHPLCGLQDPEFNIPLDAAPRQSHEIWDTCRDAR